MPAYNAEQTIDAAIHSIRKQTHNNLRLIIVDDCSTDNTYNIALEHTKDPRVKVYRNNTNMGAYYSRNAGLYYGQKYHWEYFTTHDADDVSNLDRYERILKAFRKPPILAVQDRWDRIQWPTGELIINEMTMAHAVFKRSVFKHLGFFHENRFASDWEYWQRLKTHQAQTKTRNVNLPDTGGYQWVRDTNLTVQIPLRGEERKRYVTKMRTEIEKMSKAGSLYREPHKDIAQITKRVGAPKPVAGQPAPVKAKPKTALLTLTWGRPQDFPAWLQRLKTQTYKDFDLIVSNSNREHDTFIENALKEANLPFTWHFRADSNDRLAFRRFDIAKELNYDRYVILDDDVTIGNNFMQDMVSQYQPNTYHSWFCWQIMSDDYHDRKRVNSHKQPIQYAGIGISMIDRSIVDRPELYDFPPAAMFSEDIWLTYVMQHIYKWPVKWVKIPNIVLGGADDVALYMRISKSKYRKVDFYRELLATGWQV